MAFPGQLCGVCAVARTFRHLRRNSSTLTRASVTGTAFEEAQAEGFRGTIEEWRSELRRQAYKKKYDNAVKKNFKGTFDEWNLEYRSRTVSGALPHISTLRRSENPLEEEMTLLKRYYTLRRKGAVVKSQWEYSLKRHVVFNGQDKGLAAINFAAHREDKEEIWVRPYFDPAEKALRFQGADGRDLNWYKPLAELVFFDSHRPLLHLAHAQGLIDAVPDGRLRSLHFSRTQESGFRVYSSISSKRSGEICCTATLRIHDGEAPHSVCLYWCPVDVDKRRVIYFPYIGNSGRLHLWDTEDERNLKLRRRDGEIDGYEAEVVRKRWPQLFALARKEGFWKHL